MICCEIKSLLRFAAFVGMLVSKVNTLRLHLHRLNQVIDDREKGSAREEEEERKRDRTGGFAGGKGCGGRDEECNKKVLYCWRVCLFAGAKIGMRQGTYIGRYLLVIIRSFLHPHRGGELVFVLFLSIKSQRRGRVLVCWRLSVREKYDGIA